ncbi:MAG: hypothetical protein ACTSPC_08955, partial [Candidatus Heimdallarchaeota archaeon]
MIDCEDVIKIYSDPETNVRIAVAGIEAISSGEARVGEFELEKMGLKDLLNYRLKSVGLVHQFPERTLFLTGSVWDNMS